MILEHTMRGGCTLYVSRAEAVKVQKDPASLPADVLDHLREHHPMTGSRSLDLLMGTSMVILPRLSPRRRRALEIIRDHPESAAWPGHFADLFWPQDFEGPSGSRLHAQRNKANAPMSSWWAAGYLGRLRKVGLIGGGYYERHDYGDHVSYTRAPLYLTALGEKLLAS